MQLDLHELYDIFRLVVKSQVSGNEIKIERQLSPQTITNSLHLKTLNKSLCLKLSTFPSFPLDCLEQK